MALTLYGIKNCNTVKSAVAWLNLHNIPFEFYDVKKGIAASKLENWSAQVGWEVLINRRGTTWRQLPREVQQGVRSEASAIELMKVKTSVIKRPVIERDNKIVTIGFDEGEFTTKYK